MSEKTALENFATTTSNINRCAKCFHCYKQTKFARDLTSQCLPHLRHTAAIPRDKLFTVAK